MQVTAQVIGGQPKILTGAEAATLGAVKDALDAQGYTAKVNGQTVSDDSATLDDFSFIALAEQVKGN